MHLWSNEAKGLVLVVAVRVVVAKSARMTEESLFILFDYIKSIE
jgi:hypothetical protein